MEKMLFNFKENLISRIELKKIKGGLTECSSCGEDSCSGGCESGGIAGKCGWTVVPSGRCTCATVGGGGIE